MMEIIYLEDGRLRVEKALRDNLTGGPRGGFYYINHKGEKQYVSKRKLANIGGGHKEEDDYKIPPRPRPGQQTDKTAKRHPPPKSELKPGSMIRGESDGRPFAITVNKVGSYGYESLTWRSLAAIMHQIAPKSIVSPRRFFKLDSGGVTPPAPTKESHAKE
jgi:hypothetical protein